MRTNLEPFKPGYTDSSSGSAVMIVDRRIFESILPAGRTIDCCLDQVGVDYTWLAKFLLLPSNCKITGVSTALRFMHNDVCIRILSPDFIVVPKEQELPEVAALYEYGPRFVGWEGPALRECKPNQIFMGGL